MSRYTGSTYRKSRRLGFSVLENGKELTKKPYAPGAHGQQRGNKLSNYGENFLRLLESRLDNLVYRIGFATTRNAARQLVNHGHITVNGKKVNIPSYRCVPGDVIAVKDNAKEMAVIKSSLEALNKRVEFVTYDENKMAGTYVRLPERSELNADINESLIVEFYNR